MDLDQLTARALDAHAAYDELNLRERGRAWTREEFVLGLVGAVGDVAKLAMAAEGAREMPGGGPGDRGRLRWVDRARTTPSRKYHWE